MRVIYLVVVALSVLCSNALHLKAPIISEYTSDWVVGYERGVNISAFEGLGFEIIGRVGDAMDAVLVRHLPTSFPSSSPSPFVTSLLLSQPQVTWAEQQTQTTRTKKGMIKDPLFSLQWHLINTGQFGGVEGIDINVLDAWNSGFTGEDVQIAFIDDGYQYTHPDLFEAYQPGSSFNFNDGDSSDPAPGTADFHGTSVAGIAVARANGVCGVGVAHRANTAALRLIAGPSTDSMEADAFSYMNQRNHIYSSSWGPSDNGIAVGGPGMLGMKSIKSSVTTGRNGLGNIFIWAAGNGALNNDNCNYDGFANSRYTIAVGAIGNDGKNAYYSEPCAAMLVTAPSAFSRDGGIRTTDIMGTNGNGASDCTSNLGGTSASSSIVAGVTALVLQANPMLGWRDVQFILATTASQNDLTDSDWVENGVGYAVNHKYGFGLVDASAAVKAASAHVNFPSEVTDVVIIEQSLNVPDFPHEGIEVKGEFESDITIERVVVNVAIDHAFSGDLNIVLTSPAGTESVLATPHAHVPTLQVKGHTYVLGGATFGPQLSFQPINGIAKQTSPIDACGEITNCDDLANTIAYVLGNDSCSLTSRAKAVQECRAIAMIVYAETDIGRATLPGDTDPTITIPTVFMPHSDAELVDNVVVLERAKYEINNYRAGWTMSTTRCLGESSKGTWTVRVTDGLAGDTGKLTKIEISVFGTNSSSEPIPLPSSQQLTKHNKNARFVSVACVLPGSSGSEPEPGNSENLEDSETTASPTSTPSTTSTPSENLEEEEECSEDPESSESSESASSGSSGSAGSSGSPGSTGNSGSSGRPTPNPVNVTTTLDASLILGQDSGAPIIAMVWTFAMVSLLAIML